jgi:hypothetical protein
MCVCVCVRIYIYILRLGKCSLLLFIAVHCTALYIVLRGC